jgi:putative ABC transport system permease protein
MPLFVKVRSFLKTLFLFRRVEADLDQEVQSHLEMLIEENIRAGMPPEEAQHAARMELGGLEQVKEQVRDVRIGNFARSVISDYHFGLRRLRKSPGFTTVAVLTLALGIGAATSVFSVIYNGLLRPFPYKGANRLTTFYIQDLQNADSQKAGRGDRGGFTSAEFLNFREQNQSFEDMIGFLNQEVSCTNGQATLQLDAALVTPNTFEFLGVDPLLGRSIIPEDAKPDAPPVFAMNYRLWHKHFNADSKIVGTSFVVGGVSRTLVAIMPPRFQIDPEGSDIWIPASPNPSDSGISANAAEPMHLWWPLGRLRPGLKPEAESADLNDIAQRLARTYPEHFPPQFTMVTRPFVDVVVGNFRNTLYVLAAAVAMLLLITCTNVANLLLARATTREKEFAIRAAMGASHGRLIRQILVESFVLAATGALLGCLFGYWSLKGFLLVLPGGTLPAESAITLNPAVLLFALGVTVFTALLCGLVSAIYALRRNLLYQLAGGSKGTGGDVGGGKLRGGLVVAEVALSIVLLIGAGLMTRTLFALAHVNIGFDPSNILVTELSFTGRVSPTANEKRLFFEQVLQHLNSSPGIIAATTTASLPPYGGPGSELEVPGSRDSEHSSVLLDLCSEDFFQTLGIHLLRGSLLSRDEIASARRVVVVDEALARKFFGQSDPVGQKIKFKVFDLIPDAPHDTYFEIVGVVNSVKNRGLRASPAPQAYLPYTIFGTPDGKVLVRTSGDPLLMAKVVHGTIQAVDRSVSLTETSSLESYLQRFDYALPEFGLVTLGAFAGIGLLLASVGIFGLMAYTVSIQTHAISIRIALGAQQGSILKMIFTRGLQLVAAGILIGFLASYGLTRFLASQVWGVSATDQRTFASVAILAIFAGLAACYMPARRAMAVDPMIALRHE